MIGSVNESQNEVGLTESDKSGSNQVFLLFFRGAAEFVSDLLSHDFLSMIFGFFDFFWIDIVKNIFKKIVFGKYFSYINPKLSQESKNHT